MCRPDWKTGPEGGADEHDSQVRPSVYNRLLDDHQPNDMKREITGYHQDEKDDWVAHLACGHQRHVRHDPPWMNRPWVTTPEGRERFLGHSIDCGTCDTEGPPESPAHDDPVSGNRT